MHGLYDIASVIDKMRLVQVEHFVKLFIKKVITWSENPSRSCVGDPALHIVSGIGRVV